MDNSSLNISFGIRSRNFKKTVGKKDLARRIIYQVKKMYPDCPGCIIGETRFGTTKARVFINPDNQTLKVVPKEFTKDVLVKLSKYFHKKAPM